jgi:hypothetical protein
MMAAVKLHQFAEALPPLTPAAVLFAVPGPFPITAVNEQPSKHIHAYYYLVRFGKFFRGKSRSEIILLLTV